MRARTAPPVVLAALLGIAMVAVLFAGAAELQPAEVWRVLTGRGSAGARTIVLHVRLPRLLIAVIAGAGFAVAGTILQGIVRNALADPGLLGINAGAGLAAAAYVAANSLKDDRVLPATSFWAEMGLPCAAVLGAGAAAAAIYTLARRGGVTPWRLVLVGIAVSYGLGSATIVVLTRLTRAQVAYAKIWLTGSIWASNWDYVLLSGPLVAVLTTAAIRKARVLDVLTLGEEMATGLGARVERERRALLALATGLAGLSVAVAGTVAFLGLFAPHIARRLVGVRHAILLPTAALVGSLSLCAADWIGHNAIAPREIPAGVIVAAIGAPYFIYLLARSRS